MPQLDTVTYITQYMWTLIVLLLLFSLVVLGILPKIQQQLALRASAEAGQINDDQLSNEKIDISQSKSLCDLIGVYKALCNTN